MALVDLCPELKAKIISYLGTHDVLSLQATCKGIIDDATKYYDRRETRILRKYKILGHGIERWRHFVRTDGIRHAVCLRYFLSRGLNVNELNRYSFALAAFQDRNLETIQLLISVGVNVTRVLDTYKIFTSLEISEFLCQVYPNLMNTLEPFSGFPLWVVKFASPEIIDLFCTKIQLDRKRLSELRFLGKLLFYKNWPAFIFIIKRFNYTINEIKAEIESHEFRRIFVHGDLSLIRFLFETMGYKPDSEPLHEYLGILFPNGHCESFRYTMKYFSVNDRDFQLYYNYKIVIKADIEFLKYYQTKRIARPTKVNIPAHYIDKLVRTSSLEKIQYVLGNDIYFYKHPEAYREFCHQAGRHARADVFKHIQHVSTYTPKVGVFQLCLQSFLKGLIAEGHSELFHQFVIEYNIDDKSLSFRLDDIIKKGSLDLVRYTFSRLGIGLEQIRHRGYKLLASAIRGNNAKVIKYMLDFKGIEKEKVVKTILRTNYYVECDVFAYDVLARELEI